MKIITDILTKNLFFIEEKLKKGEQSKQKRCFPQKILLIARLTKS